MRLLYVAQGMLLHALWWPKWERNPKRGNICIHGGFPGGASGKEPACQCRRHKKHGFNPGWGRFPGGGYGHPFQYFCLENPMDRRAWWAAVYMVSNSWTQLKRLRRRQWHPTPVLLPGKSHGWWSLVGCSPWGR